MNLLLLFGTVWLFTTPALGPKVSHDTIGFLGASVCALPDGATACLIGDDNTYAGHPGVEFPAIGLQYAQPIDGTSTEAIVVEADLYCEVFVIKRQGKHRMKGIAIVFDATCSTVLDPHRYRWYAKQLPR